MKPAKFDYYAPTSRDEVLELLGQHGYDAKVLAGGQSLMPMMNLRLARPAVVVDINRVEGLSVIANDGGGMTIGAMTSQRQIELSTEVGGTVPGYRRRHTAHRPLPDTQPGHDRGQPGPLGPGG